MTQMTIDNAVKILHECRVRHLDRKNMFIEKNEFELASAAMVAMAALEEAIDIFLEIE